jgi:ABC-2 type transport system ATP-binding protein
VSRADLWWLIVVAASEGAAVVVSTSYLDEAERTASVLVLDDGQQLATGTPDEIAALVPGDIRSLPARPTGDLRNRAWLRAGAWRVWNPPGAVGTAEVGEADQDGVNVIKPDLQDAVTVAVLARERGMPSGRVGTKDPAITLSNDRMNGTLADCVHVTRRFGEFTAVDQVDLSIAPGEIVGLLGGNGAGKTTLIRMLLGLLPVSDGEVRLFGQPPSRATRRDIGYVPQGLGIYDDLTVTENLQFSREVYGGERHDYDLPDALQRFAATLVRDLPLGWQRRAAFAQALAHRPKLLVLDEPSSGMDPLARARLWETIQNATDKGAGTVVTTHYMDEAEECGRLVVMTQGRVVAKGTAAQIAGQERVIVVESDSWSQAFEALNKAGLPAALVGTTLRVPRASQAEVSSALQGLPVQVREAPATLEERFFELTRSGDRVT